MTIIVLCAAMTYFLAFFLFQQSHGQVIDAHFKSAALGVEKRYVAWLPADYATSQRRYPVIYLLHGLGGNEDNWVKGGHADAAADRQNLEAIIIMADGDDGFYVNWATPVDYEKCLQTPRIFGRPEDPKAYCVKTPRYEDYIVKDLVAHVDATYRTIANRNARAIGGLSMGGFGALELAMRHPNVFGAAASHSGVDVLVPIDGDIKHWGHKTEPIGAHVRRILGEDIAYWRGYDPAVLAQKLKDGQLALYLDCGTEDQFKLDASAKFLHETLDKAGVHHVFYMGPGDHTFAFWSVRIGESLKFFADYFSRSAGAKAPRPAPVPAASKP
jgi:S-formylglutathione hydrolase FrmB